jgi:hypothetical protein
MAKATAKRSKASGRPQTKAARVKTERIVRSLGKNWGMAVQRQVLKAAADQARFHLRSGKKVGKDTVEVVIPMRLHMIFPRKGESIAADGGAPGCSCTFSQDPNGSSVCICIGPGAADCDCTHPPIVVA